MESSLLGPAGKLYMAQTHIETVEREIARYLEGNPHRFQADVHNTPRGQELRFLG